MSSPAAGAVRPRPRRWRALVLALAVAGCGAPEPDLVLVDVAVIDVETGGIERGRTIEISGDRILAVAAGAPDPAVGKRVERLPGRYVIPGLWDMHVHALWDDDVADDFLPRFTRAGITGIRDMGGDFEVLARVRSEPDPSWPRIVAAGRVLDGPRPVDPSISEAAGNANEARAAIQRLRSAGADFVKVYTLLPREAFQAAVESARASGLQVAGHVPGELTPLEAAAAGLASIEHLRDELGGLCAGASAQECAELPGRLAELGTHVTPTLTVLRAKAVPGYVEPEGAPDLDELPGAVARYWRESAEGQRRRGAAYFEERRRLFDERMETVGRLREAGVPLLAGTDTGTAFQMPGESLRRELALLAACGLTSREALYAATLGAARFLGLEDVGRIEPGQAADLVILEASPLEELRALERVTAVVRAGRWIDGGERR